MSQDLQIRVTATADTQAATGGVQQLSDATARIVPAAEAAGRGMQTLTADAYQLAQSMTRAKQAAADWSASYAVEIEAASRADMAQFARMAATTQTAEKAAGALNQTRTASSNASLGILELSRAFEDAQYGIRGVLNNIPTMLMLFGASGGVAGAVSLAAVGLSMLTGASDDAAKALERTGEAAAEAAKEKKKAADVALKSAEAAKTLKEEQLAAAAALDEIAQKYAAATAAAEGMTETIREQVEQEKKLREARMARDLAAVDAKEATGEYGAREAAEARRKIRGDGAAADMKDVERVEKAEQEEAKKREQAAVARAKSLREQRAGLTGDGVLSKADREALEKDLEAQKAAQVDAENRGAKRGKDLRYMEKEGVLPGSRNAMNFWLGDSATQTDISDARAEEAQAKMQADAARMRRAEIMAALEADSAGRAGLGVADGDELAKRRAEIEKQLAESEKAAEQARKDRADSAGRVTRQREIFTLQEESRDLQGQAERGRFTQAEEKEAERLLKEKQREDAKDGKKKAKDAKEIAELADTGRELAARAEAAGAPAAAMRQMEAAIRKMESGGGTDAVERLAGLLERWALVQDAKLAALADKWEARLRNR